MAYCALMKNQGDKYKSKKAMCASWGETECSESEQDFDDEEAMLCFMAIEKIKMKIVILK